MLNARATAGAKAREERGAALVITVVVMLVLLVVGAYAIDTAIWFVHRKHLQTEADSAALAAAQEYQFCAKGSSTDTAIINRVHQYDGTGLTPLSPTYNAQVSVAPTPASTYSSAQHNLISLVNQPNYINQAGNPGDSGLTGSPCADSVIDVKLSETNLSSFFPFFSPAYIDAQARVGFFQENQGTGEEPFAIPLPTPNNVTVQLVDENNNGANIGSPISLVSQNADHTSWSTTTALPSVVPKTLVGMKVTAAGASGGSQTYSSGTPPPYGIAYSRVWANTGSPGTPVSAPVAPQAADVWLAPTGSSCPSSPSGTFSNFMSSSTSATVQLCANMTFTSTGGTPMACGDTSLTLKVGGTNVAMTCPTGGPNGTWQSAPVTVTPASNGKDFTLSWSVTTGKLPTGTGVSGGDKGTCTSAKPCTGSFDGASASSPETVQRLFSGAYDSVSSQSSQSGTILAATMTDPANGNATITSLSQASANGKNVTLSINFLGFSNDTTISAPYHPTELSIGGNQSNQALQCNGNAGSSTFLQVVAAGCSNVFQTTTGNCPNTDSPPSCVKENPGTGKLDKDLSDGLNARVYCGGVTSGCTPVCGGTGTQNYNYWAAGNAVSQLETQSPPDPRLVTILITDLGAFSNGSSQIPVRAFAEFYLTGWPGDPCIGQTPNVPPSANGLQYTGDDDPGSAQGVLLGHFVKYVKLDPSVPPSTQTCQQTTFGNCVAILTK